MYTGEVGSICECKYNGVYIGGVILPDISKMAAWGNKQKSATFLFIGGFKPLATSLVIKLDFWNGMGGEWNYYCNGFHEVKLERS